MKQKPKEIDFGKEEEAMLNSIKVLRAELWSYFWPNCDCRNLEVFLGVLADLLKIPE